MYLYRNLSYENTQFNLLQLYTLLTLYKINMDAQGLGIDL